MVSDALRAEVVEAWKWLDRHHGTAPITELARHVMLSDRQLTTLFGAEFGLTAEGSCAVAAVRPCSAACRRIGHVGR